MNQNLCRNFTAAVLLSTAGIPFAASAEQIPQTASASFQESIELSTESATGLEHESVTAASQTQFSELGVVELADVATEAGSESADLAPQSTPTEWESIELANEVATAESEDDAAATDAQSARLEQEAVELSSLFDITAHVLEDHQIAVLRVDNLPVFKFVERSPEEVPSENKESAPQLLSQTADPVVRAEQVALQIDQFHQASGDPESIHVRWDEDLEEYVISLDGESLVLINEATYYANTTGEHAQDALHATNRLRTLLGGAEPLTEVEGQPEPEVVAARSNWDVTSMFTGQASWYGPGFHGRHTASGEVFNQNAMTAAHRTLPFGTQVRVTNVHNGRQVVVRINDRGPFSRGRVIDLSAGAARAIGLDRAGVGPVQVEVLTN